MIDQPPPFEKNPNPQGKGVVPVLRDWGTMQPALSGPKSPAHFLRDYCVSSLILHAHFRFKPVIGKTYFLYASAQGFSLSLITPQEWGQRRFGDFVADCRLRRDMTWEITSSTLDTNAPALERAQHYISAFFSHLSEQDSISAHLPFYCASLPYYQRLLATALASSLQRSLPHTGDTAQALLRALPVPTLLSTSPPAPRFLPAGCSQEVI